MLRMLQWLYVYVSSVCSNCFICFRRILQVFYVDVARVDLDVAYTCMLQAYVSKCFKRILQVFYLDVAKIELNVAYTCMLQAYVSSVCSCFKRMF